GAYCREREPAEEEGLEACSLRLATLGQVLFQDAPFGSVAGGSEPQLDDPDACLTPYPLGLDKFSLPYLSGRVPAFLASLFQLLTSVIVVCPIINPALGCSGCRFSVSDRMMASHSSSSGRLAAHSCMTLSIHDISMIYQSEKIWENLSLSLLSHQISRKRSDQFNMSEDSGKRRQPARNGKSRRTRRMRRFESKKHKR